MQCRGIRGAITVPANNKERIIAATKELLKEMMRANSIKVDDIAAIFCTVPDLNAEFPTSATGELGWPSDLALLCGHDLALADGHQSLDFDSFCLPMSQPLPIAESRNRKLATPRARIKP